MKNTMKLLAAIMTVVLTLSLMPAAMMEEIIEVPAEAVPQVEEVVLKEEAPVEEKVEEATEEKVEEIIEAPAGEVAEEVAEEVVEEVPEAAEEAVEEIAEEIPEAADETPVVEETEVEETAADEEPAGEAAEEAKFVIIYDAAVDGTNIAMLNVNDHIAIYRLVGSSYYISYLNNTCFGYLRKDDLSRMTNYCYIEETPAGEEAAEEVVEEVPEAAEEAVEEIAEEIPEAADETPVVEETEVEETAADEEPAGEAAEEAKFVIIYDAAVDGTNIAMLNVNDHIAIYRLVGSSYYISYLNNTCFGYLRKDDLSRMTNYCYIEETPAGEEAAEEVVEEPVKEAAAQTVELITEADLPANAKLMAVIEDELNAECSVSVYAAFDGDTLSFGDAVTLIAVLHGYENTTVAIQWQSSADNASWADIAGANASTYTFTVTESNYRSFWRVAVTINGVIVADELVAEAAAEKAE